MNCPYCGSKNATYLTLWEDNEYMYRCQDCNKWYGKVDNKKWKLYRKTATTEMRPYVPGEDITGISVSEQDSLEEGGMIARNPKNHADQWYVAKQYFQDNYEEAK